MFRRLALVVFFACAIRAQSAQAQIFVFDLRGSQEVPPVPSSATGGCHGQLDAGPGTLTLTCVHNVIGATAMHVHRGAAGVNGSIVFDMGDPNAQPVVATWTGMTPADVADLLAGSLYVNIHSAGRPGGEIRGQILPRTVDLVAFTADGSQVVPPNGSAATATCTADLDSNATALSVQCTHNLAAPEVAYLGQAPFGMTGPTIFNFPSASSPLAGNVPMTPGLVASFAATFLYLEIEGGGQPIEAIRGQIGQAPLLSSSITIADVSQNEGTGGTTQFVFTLTIDPVSSEGATVDYSTTDGSAIAPADYATASGTATFAPNASSTTVTVDVVGDASLEPNETFIVQLSGASGATISDAQATGTILNDDVASADVGITKSGPATILAGAPLTYTLTVSNAGPQAASNVVVNDTLPAGTTFVSATPTQGSCAGTTTVTCTLGAIASGGSATITLIVDAPFVPTTISNSAAVSNAPESDPAVGNNRSSAETVVEENPAIPLLSPWLLVGLAAVIAAAATAKLR
jgi:uncharacterized repeat protein (TIGR01451 family)